MLIRRPHQETSSVSLTNYKLLQRSMSLKWIYLQTTNLIPTFFGITGLRFVVGLFLRNVF